jgi:hypothetical protein
MKTISILLLLLPLIARAAGDTAGLQSYTSSKIAAGVPIKLGFYGDSWYHGDTYNGEEASLEKPVAKPYSWATATADPTSSGGPVFCEQIARRLQTPHWYSNSVGSMELLIGSSTASRAQPDSSIFGMLDEADVSTYSPDIVMLPGGGGGNDIFGGDTYEEICAQHLAVAKRAVQVFGRNSRFIVYSTLRPFAFYSYKRQSSGTNDEKRAAAIAEYDTLELINDFIANTLRDSLATLGVNVAKFITFDTRSYGSVATADTASLYITDSLDCSDQTEYNAARHLRWSPYNWYQGDWVHLNDYGNKSYADSIAQYLFGITLDNTFTEGAGDSIYVDIDKGNNWTNRTKCTQRSYPLATLQAAVTQARPGDVVAVIGSGNQAVMAYDSTSAALVSANDYEVRVTKPGIQIWLESGAYFTGDFQASVDAYHEDTQTGEYFLDIYNCTAGTAADTLSHSASASIYSAAAEIDLRLTITGEDDNWISGYSNPLHYVGYNDITLQNLSITGGASDRTIVAYNPGGLDMELYVEDCIIYPDSGSHSGTGTFELRTWDGSAAIALDGSTNFSGHVKNTQFLGKSGVTDSHVLGPIQGVDFINCTWDDPDIAINWLDFYTTVAMPTGTHEPTKFINCLWTTTDDITTLYALKYREELEDTLYFINCNFYAPNTTNAFIVDFGAANGTGAEVVAMGSAFVKADFSSATDLTPNAGAITDGYSVRSYAAKDVSALCDTTYYGGVYEFLGYDLEDDFGIAHGRAHASIGPTQYKESPIVLTGTVPQGVPAYAVNTLGSAALLYTTGILAPVDSTDANTFLRVQAPNRPSEEANFDIILSEYEQQLTATKQKMKIIAK